MNLHLVLMMGGTFTVVIKISNDCSTVILLLEVNARSKSDEKLTSSI